MSPICRIAGPSRGRTSILGYLNIRIFATNPAIMWRSTALFIVACALASTHAQNSTAADCASTAPSGVDTSSYVFFSDEAALCAVCGDGIYHLDGAECLCGNGDECNIWPLSGTW